MKYVEDKVVYVPQESGVEGMYKMMELAARQCYQTLDLVKEGSAHKLIDKVCIAGGHTSVLEFGTVYLKMYDEGAEAERVEAYERDRFSRVVTHNGIAYITTTYRTIMQGDYDDPIEAIQKKFDKPWLDDLRYMVEQPSMWHHKRYCFQITCDRGGGESFVRHRGEYGVSFAKESTRYCNYTKDRFGNELLISVPSKMYDLIDNYAANGNDWLLTASIDEQIDFLRKNDKSWNIYEDSIKVNEKSYINLINEGWKPEDARGVLPLDIKTQFMMSTYYEGWRMFMFRRLAHDAHPHVQSIAQMINKEFNDRFGLEFKF